MLEAVAGRDVIKTDYDKVREVLERLLDRISRGEISANRALIVLVDSDVDQFDMNVTYQGRAVEMLGFTDIAKENLIADITG